MTEQSPTNPYAEFDHLPHEPVWDAHSDDIIAIANEEARRLEALRNTYTPNGAEWKQANGLFIEAARASNAAVKYKQSGHDNFGAFLAASIDDDTTGEADLTLYDSARSWTERSSVQEKVAERTRLRQETEQVQTHAAPEAATPSSPTAEAAEPSRAIEDARRSVEKARNAELFDDIVRLGKNRTYLATGVRGGFDEIGMGPRQMPQEGSVMSSFRQLYRQENKPSNWHEELNEVVMFSDVVEHDTRQVTRQRHEKGRFGRTITTKYTDTETIPGSEHTKMMRNELTGQNEPAVRFRYEFKIGDERTSPASGSAVKNGELPRYQEFGGNRLGQYISASVELPKSVADQLRQKVHDNPESARELTEKLFLQNNDGRLTEAYWREGHELHGQPIRPPYEQLPTDWNMAIVTGQETAQYGNREIRHYQIERVTPTR